MSETHIKLTIYKPMRVDWRIDASAKVAPLDTVVFEKAGRMLERLRRAREAVLNETGRHPTHFIVGWQSYAELQHESHERASYGAIESNDEGMRILGVPVMLDPSRERYIAAIPPFEVAIATAPAKGSVWP